VPYYSRGCYFDDFFDHGRALKELYADDNMTIQMCANFAARRGWNNFGLEYGMSCSFSLRYPLLPSDAKYLS
jgi:sulfur relay (sulfurtransferase) complex TusBCD TusD component (DsrE family)